MAASEFQSCQNSKMNIQQASQKNIQMSQLTKKLVKVCLQTFNLTDFLSPKRIKIGEKARESLFTI